MQLHQETQLLSSISPHGQQLLDSVRQTKHPLESPTQLGLASFVINMLFNVLVKAVSSTPKTQMQQMHDKLQIWFMSYR